MDETNKDIQDRVIRLREAIYEYQPDHVASCDGQQQHFPRGLSIGLYGPTGVGKSSLINSMMYALNGRLLNTQHAQVACPGEVIHTTLHRQPFNLTDHIRVIDNCGLDAPNTESAVKEVLAQLDGKRGYKQAVDWYEEEADSNRQLGRGKEHGHKIHSIVVVLSATHSIILNRFFLDGCLIDELHKHQGNSPVVVITHVDEVEKASIEELASCLRYKLHINDIFRVSNLSHKKQNLDALDQLILLSMLKACTIHGDHTIMSRLQQRMIDGLTPSPSASMSSLSSSTSLSNLLSSSQETEDILSFSVTKLKEEGENEGMDTEPDVNEVEQLRSKIGFFQTENENERRERQRCEEEIKRMRSLLDKNKEKIRNLESRLAEEVHKNQKALTQEQETTQHYREEWRKATTRADALQHLLDGIESEGRDEFTEEPCSLGEKMKQFESLVKQKEDQQHREGEGNESRVQAMQSVCERNGTSTWM